MVADLELTRLSHGTVEWPLADQLGNWPTSTRTWSRPPAPITCTTGWASVRSSGRDSFSVQTIEAPSEPQQTKPAPDLMAALEETLAKVGSR